MPAWCVLMPRTLISLTCSTCGSTRSCLCSRLMAALKNTRMALFSACDVRSTLCSRYALSSHTRLLKANTTVGSRDSACRVASSADRVARLECEWRTTPRRSNWRRFSLVLSSAAPRHTPTWNRPAYVQRTHTSHHARHAAGHNTPRKRMHRQWSTGQREACAQRQAAGGVCCVCAGVCGATWSQNVNSLPLTNSWCTSGTGRLSVVMTWIFLRLMRPTHEANSCRQPRKARQTASRVAVRALTWHGAAPQRRERAAEPHGPSLHSVSTKRSSCQCAMAAVCVCLRAAADHTVGHRGGQQNELRPAGQQHQYPAATQHRRHGKLWANAW